MRKWKKLLVIVLCLMMVQAPAVSFTQPQTVEAAAVKNGLKKEKGKYYFYEDGKRVTNTWKNVKRVKNGKTTTERYYFGTNGAAYAGKIVYGSYTPSIRKVNGKTYAFGYSGRMLKGPVVLDEKFYFMNRKTGVYDAAQTAKLRKAYGYEKNAAPLRALLGKPKKIKTMDSCYGDGKDLMLYYEHFILSVYKNKQGKEIILGAIGLLAK